MRLHATLSTALALALLSSTALGQGVTPEDVRAGFEAIDDWRVDEARRLSEDLYERSPEDPLVLALVGEVKLHMSDYAGAGTYFEKAKKAGAPDMLLRNAGFAEAARVATQGYAETISDRFVIRSEPGKDAVLVPYAVETLERAMEQLGNFLGWRPDARTVVEFYPGASTLAKVSSLTEKDIKTSGTIALCKWNRLMVTSPRGVLFGYGWRDTLAHELAHLIIGGASKNTVPIWLHEGIAKYAETAWRGEAGLSLSVDQQIALRDAAKKDKLVPFSKMHPSMAKLDSQEEAALAFAQVHTFIEHLVSKKGWEGIRDVLAKMSEGASDKAAIAAVYGKPLDALLEEWKVKLPSREIKREGAFSGREVVVKDRPETPDDNLHGVSKEARRFARAADLLYTRGRFKAAQKELEKAAAQTPSPLLNAKLANVALAAGDLDVAEGAARKAIEGMPDLPGPNIALAQILVKRGKGAEALERLEHAVSINPFDPRIHAVTIEALGQDGDKKKMAQAQIAYATLTQPRPSRLPPLGTGALIEIDAVPFSRVFVELESDAAVQVPTGMITPTAPIAVRPGAVRLRLVPPVGPAITRTVTVEPVGPDGVPQRIAPDLRGS